jgi:hypothetical protein
MRRGKMSTSFKRRVLNHVGRVSLAILSASFVLAPYSAAAIDSADAASQVVASEGGKEALNAALKMARSKPALSVATTITCLACIPVAGVVASPTMCVACGILIAKTIG